MNDNLKEDIVAKKTADKKAKGKPAATKSKYEARAKETTERPGGVRAAGRGYE
ncbi:MAG TPA: hypothetical protein VI670_12650 [Thermoanaerobaculia bacterium]|jgi:hypothetical protein